LLLKDVASEFGARVRIVTEEYGNSPTAQKWGVRRYPVVFVDDVLVARPKDFGFAGADDTSKGLYVPWRDPASQERFKSDLRRMVQLRLKGEHVVGLDVNDVRTETTLTADGPSEMPDAPMTSVAGATLDPKSFKGRVVVVEMWATWCPPCLSTLKWLNSLQTTHGNRIVVLAIAVDSPPAAVQKLVGEVSPTYHVVQGTPEVIARFGEIAAVPKLFVFDADGKRTHTFYGAPPDLHQKIEAAVGALVR
jgi:thiol-disulfide isomerase/thioredoxin